LEKETLVDDAVEKMLMEKANETLSPVRTAIDRRGHYRGIGLYRRHLNSFRIGSGRSVAMRGTKRRRINDPDKQQQ
jgi:hypothetical protein